jgi:hypothetical protein
VATPFASMSLIAWPGSPPLHWPCGKQLRTYVELIFGFALVFLLTTKTSLRHVAEATAQQLPHRPWFIGWVISRFSLAQL